MICDARKDFFFLFSFFGYHTTLYIIIFVVGRGGFDGEH